MTQILKIEDVKLSEYSGEQVARFIFNNDKVVRLNCKNGEIITKNVPQVYINLISIYMQQNEHDLKDDQRSNKKEHQKISVQDKIKEVRTHRGEFLGVISGMLVRITIIGTIIALVYSYKYVEKICDKNYLLKTEIKDINFYKGFYATASLGWIIGMFCRNQWKNDMIKVLEDRPSKSTINKHRVYRIWAPIFLIFCIIYSILYSFSQAAIRPRF